MKNKIVIMSLLIAHSAWSSGFDEGAYATTLSSGMVTSAPTASLAATSQGFGRHNEILLVKQDAIVAMETGVVSEALASVIEKMRTVDSQFLGLSDEQIIEIIIKSK